MSNDETAAVLGVSTATVTNDWEPCPRLAQTETDQVNPI